MFSIVSTLSFVFFAVCGKNLETGSFLKAVVIDISEGEGLVDLSLKPELLGSVIEKGAKKSSAKKVLRFISYLHFAPIGSYIILPPTGRII